MKGVIVLNPEFNEFIDKGIYNYAISQRLMEFMNAKKWDVAIVSPHDLTKNEDDKLIFSRAKKYVGNTPRLIDVDPNDYDHGDFMWVRQVADDLGNEAITREICQLVDSSDSSEYNYLLNPKGSTKFFLKDIQRKELNNLPFTQTFNVNNICDLEELVKHQDIIGKPKMGWKGKGIHILRSLYDVDKFYDSEKINSYSFEEFIPLPDKNHEVRISFIDRDKYFVREKIFGQGENGKDILKNFVFPQITNYQKKIAESVVEQTGMHLGSVDFRGDKIIEINNAGIGLSFSDVSKNLKYLYMLESDVLDSIEKNVKK